ncbi:MAG: MipA/OmpV family protein [Fusobacteria bacterium]|nr:MipA/OmpV family protein [Fusobacteriota bacterium]
MNKIYATIILIISVPCFAFSVNVHQYIPKQLSEQELINNVMAPKNPWGLGVQAFVSPNPYCNTRSVSWVLPAVTYTSQKFDFYDTYGSYELFGNKSLSTEIVGQISPVSYNSKYGNSWAMQQLNNRSMSILLGLQENWITSYGIFEASGENDITGTSKGFMATLQYGAPVFFGSKSNTFMIEPEVGLQYDSSTLNNYYFGISQTESMDSGLSQYAPTDSWGPYEALNFVYVANQRLNFYLEFQANQLPNAVFDSPMVVKAKTILSSELIMTYSI